MSEEFLVTRQDAAKTLGVSTRTIDRYIAQEKFSVVRDNGKVLLDTRELTEFKSGQNPVVAQMVKNSEKKSERSSSKISSSEFSMDSSQYSETTEVFEVQKYKILYESAKSDIEARDELLRNMHYKLGILETESKSTIPLLEAENEKREWEEFTDKLSEENIQLKTSLRSAKSGRIFFFVLSLSFLLVLLAVFIFQNGSLFLSA